MHPRPARSLVESRPWAHCTFSQFVRWHRFQKQGVPDRCRQSYGRSNRAYLVIMPKRDSYHTSSSNGGDSSVDGFCSMSLAIRAGESGRHPGAHGIYRNVIVPICVDDPHAILNGLPRRFPEIADKRRGLGSDYLGRLGACWERPTLSGRRSNSHAVTCAGQILWLTCHQIFCGSSPNLFSLAPRWARQHFFRQLTSRRSCKSARTHGDRIRRDMRDGPARIRKNPRGRTQSWSTNPIPCRRCRRLAR